MGPLFLFSLLVSSRFLSFSCFFFHFFSFLFISSFFSFVFEKMFFILFFHFSEEKKVPSFLFCCISFKYFLMLALVSEFNCFLRSRCSMEMWCPDDIGRGYLGLGWAACLGESMLQLPRVGWRLLGLLKRSLTRLYYCCCC